MKIRSFLVLTNFLIISCWINSSNPLNWYSSWEYCLLNSSNLISNPFILKKQCWFRHSRIFSKSNEPNFNTCTIGGRMLGQICANNLSPFNSKLHFLTSFNQELDNSSISYLNEFSLLLSSLNGTLVIFGDSLIEQFTNAIHCEFIRNRSKSFNLLEIPRNTDLSYYISPYKTIEFLEEKFHLYFQKYSFLLFITNFGIHYNEKSDNFLGHKKLNSKRNYQKNIEIVLTWLNKLSSNRNMTITWMETAPQHFNTINGYYKEMKNDIYNCVSIQNKSFELDWRNLIVKRFLKTLELTSKDKKLIQYLSVRDVFLDLSDLHYNNDCTHYCWTPMLYQPIFQRLYDILIDEVINRGKGK